MFDGKFRAPVDAAVKPIGAALRKTKLTPDHLTVVGLVVGAASAVAVGAGHLRWGLVLVILAALPDLLDGALAKASNTSSQRGAFFDSTVDRITDALAARRHRVLLRGLRPIDHRLSPCCRSRSRRCRR